MRRLLALVLLAACTTAEPSKKPPEPRAPAAPKSGLDLTTFDPAVRPQDDLFRAVNGRWLATTEIPRDRSSAGAFGTLADKTDLDLRAILEEAAQAPEGTKARKAGDLYAAYLDEARIDALGAKPLEADLAAIAAIATKGDLVRRLAELRLVGGPGAFHLGVDQDPRDSERHILELSQGGLGLPDRDYYFVARYKDKLDAYGPHVARMLGLAGIADASSAASAVVALETEIARVHWTKEECRDASKTNDAMTRSALAQLAPGFDWDTYLEVVGAKDAAELIVRQPSYFAALARLLDEQPLDAWKAWLAFHVVHRASDALGRDIALADFDFFNRQLRGVPEQRPRWKRAVSTVSWNLGELLGELYVARHFPPEAKARMQTLVANLIAAYRARIERLEWASPATREKAVGSSRVDLQACKLEYSIVSPK